MVSLGKNWHDIPKSRQTMKIRMSGDVVQMMGNDQFVTGTRTSIGRAKINVTVNIKLSSW